MKFSTSVVIPTYNGKKLLEQYMDSVLAACKDCEIIVVDDASTDETIDFLTKKYPQVRTLALRENVRFANACNAGAQLASGEIILLLNNDVAPSDNFLEPLLKHFTDPEVFAVGCLEENDKKVKSGSSGMNMKRGFIVHWRSTNQQQKETAWVAGGSGAFRRSMWEQLDGMDDLFKPAYEEDRDLCYRALKRGWRVMFEPNSLVYHHHETTNKDALGLQLMQLASFKNQFVFVWKNIHSFSLLMQHICWLPYHLIFTTLRTRGVFLKAFFAAGAQLPEILRKRKLERKALVITDKEILERTSKL